MNRIKRGSAIIIIIALVTTLLTGCGVNELGYFKLSSETSKLTEYDFESQISVEIGKGMTGREEYNLDFILKGAANVEDLNSMYMDLDVSMKLDKKEIANEINLKLVDNKFYVSKNILDALLEITNAFDYGSEYYGEYYDVYKKIAEELHSELKDVEYIMIGDMGALYGDLGVLYNPYENIQYTEISDMSMNYLKKAFDGFDSKIVKKTSKGYALELKAEDLVSFAENLLDYIYNNKETVFDETIKYIEEIYSLIDLGEFEEDKELVIEEIKAGKQDFYDAVNMALFYIRSGNIQEELDFIKGSKISNEIYKEGKSYIVKTNLEIVVDNEEVIKISSSTKSTPVKVEVSKITGDVMELEEFEKLYNEIENEINPIETIDISWFQGSEYASVYGTRAVDTSPEYSSQPYTMIEGRIYLPLRYISEVFGEEVEWDEAARKAYIVRGEEKIDMTGIIVDSKTMIKIRDFEKLGYEIEYEQYEDYSFATIKK